MAIQSFTAGQVLTAAQQNIVARGASLPTCSVKRAASGVTAANVPITFDTELWDNDTMFAPSSDTITIKTAGIYSIHYYVNLGGTTGTVVPNLLINAGEEFSQFVNIFERLNVNYIAKLNVNDTVKFRVFYTGGSFNAQNTVATFMYLGNDA
jgi:hypothetical protein